MEKVIITGGAGFIGSHLVKKLIDNDTKEILVIDDLSTGKIENIEGIDQVKFENKRIEDIDNLSELFEHNLNKNKNKFFFKSLGIALWDIAIAKGIYDLAN